MPSASFKDVNFTAVFMRPFNSAGSAGSWAFVSTFIWMFAAHLYRWMNGLLVSHDSLLLNQSLDVLQEISLGRFLQPLYLFIRGDAAAPFLIGILGSIFVAAAVFVLGKMFELGKPIYIVLISGVLSANTTLALLNATYINWFDIYMLAMLTSVLAGWLWSKKGLRNYLLGSVFLFFSLALYQSYIQTFLAVLLIFLIRECLCGVPLKAIWKHVCGALIVLVLAAILYVIGTWVAVSIANISLSQDTNGIEGIGDFARISKKNLLLGAYTLPFQLLTFPETRYVAVSGLINIIISVFTLIGIGRILTKNRAVLPRIAMAIFLIFLFPLAIDCTFILAKGIVHGLMFYSFSFLYLLFFVVLDLNLNHPFPTPSISRTPRIPNKVLSLAVKAGVPVAIGILCISNIIYSNDIYLKKDLEAQSTLSTMTRILDRVEQVDGYIPGETKVVFVGWFAGSEYLTVDRSFLFPDFSYPPIWKGPKNAREIGLGSNMSVTYPQTLQSYIDNIIGCNIEVADENTIAWYASLEDVQRMDSFPAKNSCQMIGKCVVVKLD
ncbi:glucosyltransferase domain-containing protein [Adlercreutzia murintestinalis]|uniref:glucosyltransferase domain-containing protein n=1 Tax=Adlercreutzia murintestinalis TaxID=2941325 RepID=UPI00203F8330|nr:glucosyltransferase domain-containing protein [Adlercreutzia murintestinalis]